VTKNAFNIVLMSLDCKNLLEEYVQQCKRLVIFHRTPWVSWWIGSQTPHTVQIICHVCWNGYFMLESHLLDCCDGEKRVDFASWA